MSGEVDDERKPSTGRSVGEPVGTPRQQRLLDWGIELFRRIAPEADLGHHLLPEDDAVVVVHRVRGGGSIYVAPDESVLFAASALSPHLALEAFRAGRRTPVEQFVRRGTASTGGQD